MAMERSLIPAGTLWNHDCRLSNIHDIRLRLFIRRARHAGTFMYDLFYV